MKKLISFNKIDYQSIIISLILLNLAFLFHSLNFMWGNHDIGFVKDELLLTSGLFEGRFTQFIPYRLLTMGQILPILNNLIGFTFLTFALWLLGKYWKLPPFRLNYILFITFFTTLPYTLSWIYFALNTISCFLWPLVSILGLYLSEYIKAASRKKTLTTTAVFCFYITLGGYPPIINTIFVCLSGRLTIAYLFEQKSIKDLWNIYKYTLLNIFIAAILFKLTLKLLPPDNVYNLETTPLTALPTKFIQTLKIAFTQFFITTPFMERSYKAILALMSFIAIIGAMLSAPTLKHRIITLLFICSTIWLTGLTTFLVLPHTEYVSRIDFYGFAFLYSFFAALLFKYKANISQSIALLFMLILIPFNIINDYRAQKIWKQGFDAEFEILNRIIERIESHPNFTPQKKYRFYQIGDISLRPNFYHNTYNKEDVFLLTLPYLAMWQGSNLLEFYSPYTYIDRTTPLLPSDITPEVYDFFINQSRPWPHANAIYINQNIIIVIYNQIGLEEFRAKIRKLYQ